MKTEHKCTYTSEWQDTLQTLRQRNSTFREFRYFLNLASEQADKALLAARSPRVITLGHAFPEEIIRALGEHPFQLLGGSLAAAALGEPLVPRDTDSSIKHILGMLLDPELRLTERAILLLPLTGDSMRKLRDLLADQMTVIPFEVPNDTGDPLQLRRWHEEVLRVTLQLEKHLHRKLSRKKLLEQCRLSAQASDAWSEFCRVCSHSAAAVSGSGRLWIAGSRGWCSDLQEWTHHLQALTEETLRHGRRSSAEPPHFHVVVMGSPIYAPNYKVPFLLEEMGLELYACIHPDILRLSSDAVATGNRTSLLLQLADSALGRDISPAFIENTRLSSELEDTLRTGAVNGVIGHILKGQIEYDFELNRTEPLLDQYAIPVFRLETDYNYQDVEQLRIRLEAFAEMLRHRAGISGREAWYAEAAI